MTFRSFIAFFSFVIALVSPGKLNSKDEAFYDTFKKSLEEIEGMDKTISQCVIDTLRANHATDSLGYVTISDALKRLSAQIEKAASECLPSDFFNDGPSARGVAFDQPQALHVSISQYAAPIEPEQDYPSHYLSTQGAIYLSIFVSILIVAKLAFVAYAIHSRRQARRASNAMGEDDPLLR